MRIAERNLGRLPVMFMSGAAPLPQQIFEAIKKDVMMPVSEGYGLTECGPLTHANLSTFSKITGMAARETLGIGLPVPDAEVKIVDLETGDELAAGRAAAPVRLGHFDEVEPFDKLQNFPGLFPNLLSAAQMTGIVIGYSGFDPSLRFFEWYLPQELARIPDPGAEGCRSLRPFHNN